MDQILILYTYISFFFNFLRPSISSFSMKGYCLITFWKTPTCVNIFDSCSWLSRFVLTPASYIFEVQMWWHGSIDGYASDTRGLGLGQQQWALHRNACSTGTLDTCLCPSSRSVAADIPQSLADETQPLPPLSIGLVDQEGVTRAVRQGEQYWLK